MKLITSFGVLLVLLQVHAFLARAQFEMPTEPTWEDNGVAPEDNGVEDLTYPWSHKDVAWYKHAVDNGVAWDEEDTYPWYKIDSNAAENSPEATAAGAPTTPEKKKTFAEKAKNFLRRKSPILRKKRSKSTSDLSELSRDDSEQTTPEKKKSHFAKVKSAILRKKRSKSTSDLSELSRDDSEQTTPEKKKSHFARATKTKKSKPEVVMKYNKNGKSTAEVFTSGRHGSDQDTTEE